MPQLRPERRLRIPIRRRDSDATSTGCGDRCVGPLPLLPVQRCRGSERVVVPPVRLPGLVSRAPRHPDQHRGRRSPTGSTISMSDRRLSTHPAQRVDRSETLTFTFDGKRVPAYRGETIAAALCAADVDTLSRSFKYHRRRGLLCTAGRCANCLMTVVGVPNVRTCLEPVREGAVARSQHAWPSLE